jgi:hypothetical protein
MATTPALITGTVIHIRRRIMKNENLSRTDNMVPPLPTPPKLPIPKIPLPKIPFPWNWW